VSGILKFPDFSLTLSVFPDFPWLTQNSLTVGTLALLYFAFIIIIVIVTVVVVVVVVNIRTSAEADATGVEDDSSANRHSRWLQSTIWLPRPCTLRSCREATSNNYYHCHFIAIHICHWLDQPLCCTAIPSGLTFTPRRTNAPDASCTLCLERSGPQLNCYNSTKTVRFVWNFTYATLKHINKNLHITLQKHRTSVILLRFKIHHWNCTLSR